MSVVGVDIEQFVTDPYGSGIQRVLQRLAMHWPADVGVDFVVPAAGGHALLTAAQAAEILSIPFSPHGPAEPGARIDLRPVVADAIDALDAPRVPPGDLLAIHDAWLLPEVSYLPSVLNRVDTFRRCMPTAMVGYDALPMTDPANYRFVPGRSAWVSEYFRLLAGADTVVAISDYARDAILDRLRRDRRLPIVVAHPGGDHVDVRTAARPERLRLVRLGTFEARKRPVEIVRAFTAAVEDNGLDAELVLIGRPSASDSATNAEVRAAIDRGLPITWLDDASDESAADAVAASSLMLALGTEGFGIPVLESIRLGTPVLYDGIQPAADLMRDRGATPINGLGHDDLVAAIVAAAGEELLAQRYADLDPAAVPTWADFARTIASAASTAG